MEPHKIREKFLGKVSEALNDGKIAPVRKRAGLKAPDFPFQPEKIELLARKFIAEAVRVGVLVHRAADAEEARKHLENIARKYEARLAVIWDDPLLDELGVDALLKEMGVELVSDKLRDSSETGGGGAAFGNELEEVRKGINERAAEATLGITGADYAIAETGTLVLIAAEGRGRSISALPPVHVAVVETERLVSSMEEFLALKSEKEGNDIPGLDNYISFITGPSRTGDIELALTIGVHGPRELHVVLLGAGQEPK